MIVCPRCTKENQDHYKFCLGCGAELPRDAAQPKSFTAPTPPSGTPIKGPSSPVARAPVAAPAAPLGGGAAMGNGGGGAAAAVASPARAPVSASSASAGAAVAVAQPAPAAARTPDPASDTITCPQCGQVNPRNFKFCGSCGFNLQSMGAAAKAPAPARPSSSAQAVLVLIRPDGTEGESITLPDGSTTIGRATSGPFANDAYLSPRHATFTYDGKTLHVRDEHSLNGVYLRIDPEVPFELEDGTIFRIGQEIVRFERLPEARRSANDVEVMGSPNPGYLGRIALVVGKDTDGNAFCVPNTGLFLGRERGDVIFPDDGYVSGLHCQISGEDGNVFLTDVGSSNGTFVRIHGEATVAHGALLLMGQQLFRVQLG